MQMLVRWAEEAISRLHEFDKNSIEEDEDECLQKPDAQSSEGRSRGNRTPALASSSSRKAQNTCTVESDTYCEIAQVDCLSLSIANKLIRRFSMPHVNARVPVQFEKTIANRTR